MTDTSGDHGPEQDDHEFGQWREQMTWEEAPTGPVEGGPWHEQEGWDGSSDGEGGDGGGDGGGRRPGRRRKRALIATGAVAGVAVLALVAVNVLSSGAGPLSNTAKSVPTTPSPTGFQPSATDPSQAAQQTAQAFLTDWQSGNDAAAAALTDSPAQAKAALDAYRTDLNVSDLSFQVQSGDESGAVTFGVSATLSLPGTSGGATSPATAGPTAGSGSNSAGGVWSYTSSLTAYASGKSWLVQWNPDIMAANLTADTHLMLVPVPPGAGTVTDAQGNDLSQAADPGLQHIATQLAQSAPSGQGTPGVDVAIADSSNTPIPGVAAAVVSKPVATGNIKTTIDQNAEVAAMTAVHMYPQSSMVVIQPSTGDILAIGNNDGDNDEALTSKIAPGSTMKVITSTALLNQGLTPDSPVGCPQVYDGTGFGFQNSDNESRPSGNPFIDDFAASCNNAFTSQYQKLEGGVLANTAQTYFGLNELWNIGLPSPQKYFAMSGDSDGTELAAEAFGQGSLAASPLAMASVAATVDTGSFHQPILIAGMQQVGATPLPHGTDSDLWSMMRAVITYPDGTAHGVGYGSGVYAKTGTADHGAAGATPNSWMIVFDPGKDIAIGCVVLGGDFGAVSAGPETKSVLDAM